VTAADLTEMRETLVRGRPMADPRLLLVDGPTDVLFQPSDGPT
jgi:hypothetical protein